MARIAFIGLGKMGLGMATGLLMAGHTVKVYNRTATKADPVVRVGAHLAATPRQACIGADAVISMTADDPASRAVLAWGRRNTCRRSPSRGLCH